MAPNYYNGNDSDSDNFMFGLIPNQSITFYLDYPDYTGKIQHGCEFQLTDLNNNTNINRIELNQLTVPNFKWNAHLMVIQMTRTLEF